MVALTPRERILATFVLDNLEHVPLLNSSQLAQEAGISSATVTRFSQRIGYTGFLELQDSLRSELRAAYQPGGPESLDGFIAEFWRIEAENLADAARLPEDTIHAVVDLLVTADSVWLGGIQTMRPVAVATEYFLSLFRPRTYLLVEDMRTRPEALLDVQEGDLAMLFTIRRYARATTRLGEELARKGATLLLITDDGAPPLARVAHKTVRLPTKAATSMRSITTFLQFTQLLALLVGSRSGNERSEAAERLFRAHNTFEY